MIFTFKKHQFHIVSICIIFFLFLAFNWKLVSNLSTALNDWYDYPLMVYVQQQNIKHLMQLDFANFGNISMYHNSPGGMYFTDLLLPQSLMGMLLYPLFNNPITNHNLVFLIVGLLNIVSLQYFWSKIFKDKRIITVLTLLFTFSPYTLSMYAHYQMISYWFFFFSIGRLITAKKPVDYVIAGALSGLQFLAAIYLGMYALSAAGIFFLWQILLHFKSKQLSKVFIKSTLFLIGFLTISGYFIYQFAQIKSSYNISRSADEYVNHSMQITDFLFNPLPSVWVEYFYKYVNVNNHRLGGETFGTGFVLMTAIFYGLYRFSKAKLNKTQNFVSGFMILLGIWGFIAILGPRLSINGKYLAIPLPYILPLKLTPIFDALRVISRWFFVLQIVFLYFVGFGLQHLLKTLSKKRLIVVLAIISALYILEIIPIRQRTGIDTYKSYSYNFLVSNCQQDQVVLEYPFAPEQPKTHVLITLNYWTKMLLNNMHYDCQMVNGYSGFQPKHIDDFIHYFRTAIENSDLQTINQMLDQKDVSYIKFNKQSMIDESIKNVTTIFSEPKFNVILEDSEYLLVKVK